MQRADILMAKRNGTAPVIHEVNYATIDRRSMAPKGGKDTLPFDRPLDDKKRRPSASIVNDTRRTTQASPPVIVNVTRSPKMEPSTQLYGQLIVIGYNGPRANDTGRYQTRFHVRKRLAGNGLKPVRQIDLDSPESKKVVAENHTTTYYSKDGQGSLVQYGVDIHRDMFQIGRSAEHPVDYIVMDTVPGAEAPSDTVLSRSTISRFACRVLVERRAPHHVRIFAACFDPNNRIYLGDVAPKWKSEQGIYDGLTTNGVYVMHPQGPWGKAMKPTIWREVSVSGSIFGLRGNRSSRARGSETTMETNVLRDGSLVDLCGVTMMWRTPEGLAAAPTMEDLRNKREELNAKRIQCPVGLTTLRFPSDARLELDSSTLPHVYMTCGHVHGFHVWGIRPSIDLDDSERSCPICRKMSPFMQLKFGMEPTFYIDNGPATHAFTPCGHVTTEATARYWAQTPIPFGKEEFPTVCPFCAVHLEGNGFVRLIFQTDGR